MLVQKKKNVNKFNVQYVGYIIRKVYLCHCAGTCLCVCDFVHVVVN